MKKTVCDSCSSENARSYQYKKGKSTAYTDLCMNCVQDFVLKHQTKLMEVTDSSGPTGKRVIHG